MKDTVSRVGRITKYVVVPVELITPVSDVAAGAVVKVTKIVGTGPVTRQTAKVRSSTAKLRSSMAQLSVTRLRFRRGSRGADDAGGAATVAETAQAPSSDAPDASDAPGSST